MKKIFTLIAVLAMVLNANAGAFKTEWNASDAADKTLAAGDVIIDADLVKVATALSDVTPTKLVDDAGADAPITYAGLKFTHYIGVRVETAPTASDPAGTAYDGCTPLIFTAKKNVDITLFYKADPAKGILCYDQTGSAAVSISATEQGKTDDGKYTYFTGVYQFQAGHTYTVYLKGGTVQLHAIDYATGTYVEPSNKIYQAGTAETVGDYSTITYGDGASLALLKSGKSFGSAKSIKIDGADYTTIKGSNGAQNKFTAADGKAVASLKIYSYVNATATDAAAKGNSYWKEINGTAIEEANATIMQDFTSVTDYQKTPDVFSYTFDTPVTSFTFNNAGVQSCFVLDVTYVDASTGINNIAAATTSAKAKKYMQNGQLVIETAKGTFNVAGARVK